MSQVNRWKYVDNSVPFVLCSVAVTAGWVRLRRSDSAAASRRNDKGRTRAHSSPDWGSCCGGGSIVACVVVAVDIAIAEGSSHVFSIENLGVINDHLIISVRSVRFGTAG